MKTGTSVPATEPGSVLTGIGGSGWLESTWVGTALLVVLLLAVVVLVRALGRRRRGWRLVPAGAAVALLAALTTLAYVNSYVGYVPDTVAAERMVGLARGTGTAHRSGRGVVGEYHVGAPDLRVTAATVWVYLPPRYDAPGNHRRYPVVYLLHGFPGRAVDWFAAGRIDSTMDSLIAAGAMPPAIVVAPDMNGSAGIHDTEGLDLVHGPQVQTYLYRTVPAWADATFRTIPEPSGRVIGGMSAGGYAALNIGLRHQEVFGAILALEPSGDPGPSLLAALCGSRAAYAAQSPSAYLPTMRFTHPVPTFVDEGALTRNDEPLRLAGQLRHRGQPVLYRSEPGQTHTWTEARAGVGYGLVWTAGQLRWPVAGRTRATARP